jgi:WD40 repeat protein
MSEREPVHGRRSGVQLLAFRCLIVMGVVGVCCQLLSVGPLFILILPMTYEASEALESLMPSTTKGLVRTLRGHTEAITCVAFSSDGTTLASGSGDTTVRLWNTATGKELGTPYEHPTTVNAVAFSPDDTLLASANGWYWVASPPLRFGEQGPQQTPTPRNETPEPTPNKVILWNLAAGAEQAHWEFENPMYTVAFSPDGKTLAAGGGNPSRTGSFGEEAVWLWNVTTGGQKGILKERKFATVWDIAFTLDGTILASGNAAGITLWDISTGEPRASLGNDSTLSVTFSPDGTLLASGSLNGTVHLWDTATGQEQAALEKHTGAVHAVAFSPDGGILASGGHDGTVCLWNVKTGDRAATIRIAQTQIWSVAFSPDGLLLASGSGDGLIRLWDVAQVLGQ